MNLSWTSAAAIAACASMMATPAALAGEKEDALIAKVTTAYGGAKLVNLKSLKIEEEQTTAFPGQGYSSKFVEFTTQKQDIQIDLVGERGSFEFWTHNWNFSALTRTVSAGDDIAIINYATGDYQPAAAPNFYTAFGVAFRISDTLLAHELHKRKATAVHQGSSNYLGRPHEILSFEMPQSPAITVHIDSETGFITRMTRETPAGALSYLYRDHALVDGVGYAKKFEFLVGPTVNIVSVNRKVTPNAVRPSVFAIENGIAQEPQRVATNEMTVDRVADGVHLAGTGNAYSMFVDAGDHVISAGGYAGFKDRNEAYKKAAGHDKPLRYHVVTHHHTDHLGGMADAFALGASFVTPANAVDNLNTAVGQTVPSDRVRIVSGAMTLGPVAVHDVWTNHAESNALVYVPAAKIAFETDHYGGVYVDAPTPAGRSAVFLKNAIGRAGLDVATLVSEHNRKVSTWAEFSAAVAAYQPDPCPRARAICRQAGS